jgi:hypothetical protein
VVWSCELVQVLKLIQSLWKQLAIDNSHFYLLNRPTCLSVLGEEKVFEPPIELVFEYMPAEFAGGGVSSSSNPCVPKTKLFVGLKRDHQI